MTSSWRRALGVLAVTAGVVSAPLAQVQPDFSGVWTLEEAKSDRPLSGRGGRGSPGVMGPVTIRQTPSDITIGMATYKLDGSATTIEGRGGLATARARWDGVTLVIETSRKLQGAEVTTREVRSLNEDGSEMTVMTSTTTPQGTLTRKLVFSKS
jgi:hypothetical protein